VQQEGSVKIEEEEKNDSPHWVSNQRLSGLYKSALTTTLLKFVLEEMMRSAMAVRSRKHENKFERGVWET
jgi:hypothetical protein